MRTPLIDEGRKLNHTIIDIQATGDMKSNDDTQATDGMQAIDVAMNAKNSEGPHRRDLK